MKKFLSIAALSLAMVACSDDDNTNVVPVDEVKTIDRIGAVIPETRTYLGDGNAIYWSEGDQISVWTDKTQNPVAFTLESGAGTASATFTVPEGAGVEKGTIYKAVYPANANGNITVPSNQTWGGFANFYKNVNPMVGTSPNNKIEELTFSSPCGILVVEASAEEENTVLARIELSSTTDFLSGTAAVDFTGTTANLAWNSTSYSVTLQCGQTITTDKNSRNQYYIVVPAQTYGDLTVKLVYKKGNEASKEYTKTRNASLTVKPGTITKVGAKFDLQTKTYAVGDLYPNADAPQGVVFEVADGGRSGKIVALKDCTTGQKHEYDTFTWWNYAWGNYSSKTSTSDGLSNTNTINDSGISAPAIAACVALRNGSTIEWYLPAEEELSAYLVINKNASFAQNISEYEPWGGEQYWTSTVTDMGSDRRPIPAISYYDALGSDNTLPGMTAIRLSSLNLGSDGETDGASVRAFAQF